MKRIVVGNDLSARSDLALSRAARLAHQFTAKLEVITVLDELFFEATTAQKQQAAEDAVARQVKQLPTVAELDITTHVAIGSDFNEIIQHADQSAAELIVLGPHRLKHPELFRGTTAERVIRYGTRPVLVAKHAGDGPYKRVLVPTDLSAHAAQAARVAAQLAPGGEIVLLHAVQRPFTGLLSEETQAAAIAHARSRAVSVLDALANELRGDLGDRAPEFVINVAEGTVLETIDQQIAAYKPDLIAMGTHGRTGIAHALIGSVAADVLSRSHVDGLVCTHSG